MATEGGVPVTAQGGAEVDVRHWPVVSRPAPHRPRPSGQCPARRRPAYRPVWAGIEDGKITFLASPCSRQARNLAADSRGDLGHRPPQPPRNGSELVPSVYYDVVAVEAVERVDHTLGSEVEADNSLFLMPAGVREAACRRVARL